MRLTQCQHCQETFAGSSDLIIHSRSGCKLEPDPGKKAGEKAIDDEMDPEILDMIPNTGFLDIKLWMQIWRVLIPDASPKLVSKLYVSMGDIDSGSFGIISKVHHRADPEVL